MATSTMSTNSVANKGLRHLTLSEGLDLTHPALVQRGYKPVVDEIEDKDLSEPDRIYYSK